MKSALHRYFYIVFDFIWKYKYSRACFLMFMYISHKQGANWIYSFIEDSELVITVNSIREDI